MNEHPRVAVLGCGTIGTMVARLLVSADITTAARVQITRRNTDLLSGMKTDGYVITSDNAAAASGSDVVMVCVEPAHIGRVLDDIRDGLDAGSQVVISVVAGFCTDQIIDRVQKPLEVVRAMPNTALRVGQAITALSTNRPNGEGLEFAQRLFAAGGRTVQIREEQMNGVTALGGSGPAFFLTAVEAAIAGGVLAGLEQDQAREIALQVMRGVIALMDQPSARPSDEIATIVTPNGCTAAGLVQLKASGFAEALSSAVVTAAERASELAGTRQTD